MLLFPSGKACLQQGGCCPDRVSGHLTLSGPSRGRTQGAFSAVLKSSYVAAGTRALKPWPLLPTGARKEERESLGCHSQDCGEQITLSKGTLEAEKQGWIKLKTPRVSLMPLMPALDSWGDWDPGDPRSGTWKMALQLQRNGEGECPSPTLSRVSRDSVGFWLGGETFSRQERVKG